ncbi:hypothetical protein BDW72DRAFT_147816 [Aspergillus terricola var. indicus]
MPDIVGIVPLWRNRGEDLQNTFPSLLVSSLGRVKTRVRGRYHGTKPLWNAGQRPTVRCSGDSVGIWSYQPGPGTGLRLYRNGRTHGCCPNDRDYWPTFTQRVSNTGGRWRKPVPVAERRSESGVAQASKIGIAMRNTEDRVGEGLSKKRGRRGEKRQAASGRPEALSTITSFTTILSPLQLEHQLCPSQQHHCPLDD